jgi:hypothetical protein
MCSMHDYTKQSEVEGKAAFTPGCNLELKHERK